MKNKILTLLLVCVAICLVGCGSHSDNPVQTSRPTVDDSVIEQEYVDDKNYDIWSAIKDLDFPTEYYGEYTVTHSSQDSEITENIRIIKSEDRWWAAIDQDGVTRLTYSCEGGDSFVLRDHAQGQSEIYKYDDTFCIERELGLVSAPEIADALAEYMVSGRAETSYGKIMRAETEMLSSSSRNIADIFFYYQGRDAFDEYLIDLETGMVVVVDSFENGDIVYSVSLDNYLDDKTVDISEIYDLYLLTQK